MSGWPRTVSTSPARSNNLGSVAYNRADLEAAEAWHLKALEIRERFAPGSLGVAGSFNNLGAVVEGRGDLEAAETWYRRALEIQERLAPGGLSVAASLNNLGFLASGRGDPDAAEEWHRKSVKIRERLAPGSLILSMSFGNLGVVAMGRGDLEAAEAWHRKALEIRQRMAPGTSDEAKSANALGTVYHAQGRLTEALDMLARSVAALEAQHQRMGGSQESRSGFRATYIDYYREYLEALVEAGRPEEALQVLERSRARGLLDMLAERDLVFSADVPEELDSRRRMTNAIYDRTQARLVGLSPINDADKVDALVERVGQIRQSQQQIRDEIRRLSPRLAALQYPEPLDLGQVWQSLDAGTVALAYSLGEERSFLFVIGPGESFRVQEVPVEAGALRDQVEHLRRVIGLGRAGAAERPDQAHGTQCFAAHCGEPVRPAPGAG